MRIVCISDNHDQNLKTKFTIPEGDILIHAGDASAVGDDIERFQRVGKNIRKLGFDTNLYVFGNHDHMAHTEPEWIKEILAGYGVTMLVDEGYEKDGVTFWGSGWLQPKIGFAGEYGGDFKSLLSQCPSGVDVLITHQPPYSIMDQSGPESPIPGDCIGSTVIYWEVFRRIRPRFHVFGHNHSEHGIKEIDGITFINAALVNDLYQPAFQPIVIDVDLSKERP